MGWSLPSRDMDREPSASKILRQPIQIIDRSPVKASQLAQQRAARGSLTLALPRPAQKKGDDLSTVAQQIPNPESRIPS
jgi:hypothetical protein